MHRRPLLALLDRYAARFPQDLERAGAIRRFVESHSDCFERSCVDGHVTGSAWIVSRDGEQVLLVRHRKLGAWLQPGGHADGDTDPAAVARREAEEESGLRGLSLVDWWRDGSPTPQPFDVDVHTIPARGAEPEHLHLDIRYLLVADPADPVQVSPESDEVRWVPRREIPDFNREPSVLRMADRAITLLTPMGTKSKPAAPDPRAAAIRARAALLTSFSRTISHDLRNRVNAARLSFSVVRLCREEQRAEALEALDSSLKQLEEAVAFVSTTSLAQARVLPGEAGPLPLAELVRSDLEEVVQAARVEVRIAQPVPAVAVDAVTLRLALINLVANAVKHADRGKGERWVEVRVRAGATAGEWRVDVEDNGLGLPGVERVLGAETPADAPAARLEMGIVLAQEAVGQLGGRLWVEANKPGQGTTVSFTMQTPA